MHHHLIIDVLYEKDLKTKILCFGQAQTIMKLLLLTVFFKLYLKTSAINPSDCGHPLNQNSADRILGGTDAEPGEFPWQSALIRRYTTGNGDTKMDLCGGTYIEQSWVLTAAHCIMISNDPEQYTVFIGVYDDQRTNGHEASVIKVNSYQFLPDQARFCSVDSSPWVQ